MNKSISIPSKSRHEHSKSDQENILLSTIFISFMMDILQAPLSFQNKPSCVSCQKTTVQRPPLKVFFMCENAPGFHADLHKATVVSLPLCDLPTMSSSNVHLRRCKEHVQSEGDLTQQDWKTVSHRIHGTGIFNCAFIPYKPTKCTQIYANMHGPCGIRQCQRRKHVSANVFGFFEMSTQN